MNTYVVYVLKHSAKPIYVGCTTMPLKDRLYCHKSCRSHNLQVRSYLDSHGRDLLSICPIASTTSKQQSKICESYYISYLDTFHNGCNGNSHGGSGIDTHSAEARAKVSKFQTGLTRSPESRAKMSKFQKGRIRKLGYKHTPETRAKMSGSRKHPVREHSDEIVRLYNEEGLNQREIASKFGCSCGTISLILKHHKATNLV